MILRRYSHAYWNLPAVLETQKLLPVGTFDVILANDIETVAVALSLQPSSGVHADLHEYFPELKTNDWKWRLFVAPYMAWLCRTFLPRAGSRTAGSFGFARRYEADLGIPFDVVTNAAPYVDREPTPVHDPIKIIYTTAGARARKIELVLEAMKGAPDHIVLDLIVMPNEPEYVAELKLMGAQIPGVRFREPVQYDALVDTVAEYDVALSFIPPTNFSKANALPNKFFEAVQARVGVIIGPGPEMSPLLEKYHFGESTKDYDARSLAATLRNLTPTKVAEWKEAAHRAAPELSSEQTVQVWSRALAGLLNATGSPSR
jgi:hypothetical protein